MSLSIMGDRVNALEDPTVAPVCQHPGCGEAMVKTEQTMTLQGGSDHWTQLKCSKCNRRRWYRTFAAYALLPEQDV